MFADAVLPTILRLFLSALPVSRSRRGPFLSALTDFIGDNGHVR